jgi:hypothetical protein
MQHAIRGCGLLLLLSVAATAAWAGEIIAHDTVELGVAEVREVYLGERQFQGNLRLVAVNNAAVFDRFLGAVLQSDARHYASRWMRKSFREGMVPPEMMGSDAEVTAFVKATPGAVGYVDKASSGVKVLERF